MLYKNKILKLKTFSLTLRIFINYIALLNHYLLVIRVFYDSYILNLINCYIIYALKTGLIILKKTHTDIGNVLPVMFHKISIFTLIFKPTKLHVIC